MLVQFKLFKDYCHNFKSEEFVSNEPKWLVFSTINILQLSSKYHCDACNLNAKPHKSSILLFFHDNILDTKGTKMADPILESS